VRDGPPGLEANRLRPWLTQRWCIPPEHDAEFVWRMEDVLGVSTRPYDPLRPQVCLDEPAASYLGRSPRPCRRRPGGRRGRTTSTCGKGCATCSWSASRWLAGAR